VSQQTTSQSFDDLAKGLATGTLSRGKALRWMGGALLGAALASVPGVAWANDCRRLGRACRRDSQCCSRNCIRRGDHKVCGCPQGQTRCNDRCVNLERNENHCGECFNRCDEGQECVGGRCLVSCTPGTTGCCSAPSFGTCFALVDGGTACATVVTCFKEGSSEPITSCSDCPPGSLCAQDGPIDCLNPNASIICVVEVCPQ